MSTIAVIVLLLLFVDQFSDYFVLLAVIEIGIITVIIWALASIVNYATNETNMKEALLETHVRVCPDMWKRDTENICSSKNIVLLSEDDINEYRYNISTAMGSIDLGKDFKSLKYKNAMNLWKNGENVIPEYSWSTVEAVYHISTPDV